MTNEPKTPKEPETAGSACRAVVGRGSITVECRRYKVLDNMGFQHSRGVWAKEVETDDGPRIAIKGSQNGAQWEWAKPIFAPAHYICGQDA